LDTATGELRKAGVTLKIHPQPFRVLTLLAERPDQIVTREEIQHCLWGGNTFVDYERGINFCINQIRATLGDDAEKPHYIKTLHRRGYRFIAPVVHDTSPQQVSFLLTAGTEQARITEVGEVGNDRQPAGVSGLPAPVSLGLTAPAEWAWRKLTVAAVGVLIVTAGFGAFSKYRATFQKPKLNLQDLQISKLTDTGNVGRVAISPDGRYVVYEVRDARGSSLHVHHVDMRSDVEVLPPDLEREKFLGLTFSPDGDRIYFVQESKNIAAFNFLYVVPVLGGPQRLLGKYADTPVSFSPNGQQFTFTEGLGERNLLELRIANADGTGNRLLTSIENGADNFQPGPAWSPDGKTIAVSVMLRGERVRWVLDLVSVADGSVRELYTTNHELGRPAWLPEGNTVLITNRDQTGRGQVWAISYPRGKAARLTNDLENYHEDIDVTRDGKSVALLATTQVSNIWIVSRGEVSSGQKITSSAAPLTQVAAMPLGKLLARSVTGEMSLMNVDGSERLPFTTAQNANSPTSCGAQVVFNTSGDRATDLVRTDGDGLNYTKLFSGDIGPPTCSPDGNFVFFVNTVKPYAILRLSVNGGEPTEIAKSKGFDILGRLAISPDGKSLAYAYDEGNLELGTKLVVIPVGGANPISHYKVPTDLFGLLWSPDGKGLQYLVTRDGATNIWEQPLAGDPPRQLTKFTSGRIFDFGWTADGKQLLLARGEVTSDVVLLSNLR
jgi:Tol biopolymer transport system component/DNA-binding winged helix-turn-helix (wHTH) protein